MADFGYHDVPKLQTLTRAMLINNVYPPECGNPACTWVINVCFHVDALPNLQLVRDFFCKQLAQYTKLSSVANPETGEWLTVRLDAEYHVIQHVLPEEPGAPLTELNRLINTELDITKPLWRVHLLPACSIEGAAPERSLIVFRVHHCVTDGVVGLPTTPLALPCSLPHIFAHGPCFALPPTAPLAPSLEHHGARFSAAG